MANQQQCPNAQKSLVFCSIIPPILHMNLVVPICRSYKSQSNLARGRSLWHKLRRKIYKPGFMQCHLLFASHLPRELELQSSMDSSIFTAAFYLFTHSTEGFLWIDFWGLYLANIVHTRLRLSLTHISQTFSIPCTCNCSATVFSVQNHFYVHKPQIP